MIIEYQGYLGKVEFDEEHDLFHGEVLNIRDVVTFQGKSARELKKALKDSVEDYLDYCRELSREPEKPFSGKFVLRLSPELHKALYARAQKADKSLNQWIVDQLQKLAC